MMDGLELKEQHYRRHITTLEAAWNLGCMGREIQDAMKTKIAEYREKLNEVILEQERRIEHHKLFAENKVV